MIFFTRLFIPALCCLFASAGFAQGKAKVTITRQVDGKSTSETREIDLNENQDIQLLLEEMGVMNEFGQLKEGQQFEINVQKSQGAAQDESRRIFIFPDGSDTSPRMPEMGRFDIEACSESKAYLGVMMKDVSISSQGIQAARITEVIAGTPAEEAGLEMGDLITHINGDRVESAQDVVEMIQSEKPGEDVKLTILRNEKKKNIKVELDERAIEMRRRVGSETPSDQAPMPFFDLQMNPDSIEMVFPREFEFLRDSFMVAQPFSWHNEGFALENTPFLGVTPGADLAGKGVVIGSIVPGSSAEEMGLQEGDVILSINQTAVNEFNEMAELIGALEPGGEVELSVQHNGREKKITGTLGSRQSSNRQDLRIFHDFKGMDEGGQFLYEYEFDLDSADIELQMDELLRQFQLQQSDETQGYLLEENFDRLREQPTQMSITIQIMNIPSDEATAINQNASPQLEVRNDFVPDRISFFPNPSNGVLQLNFSTQTKGDLRILVYNATGATVYEEILGNFSGDYSNEIDFSQYADGAYYLQLIQNDQTFSRKLIKGK